MLRAKWAIGGWLFILVATTSFISGCADTVHFKTFSNWDQASAQMLNGYIKKPEGTGPFPAVVLLHGCAGINQAHSYMADQLVKQGYVALIVDSFSTRGFYNGICDTRKLDTLTRAQDAYGALIHLQRLPYVDAKRIALIGWSHGGASALVAVDTVAFSNYPEESTRRFMGVVAYYPSCLSWASSPSIFTEDILLLIGDRDDWDPPQYCERMINRLSPKSKPVDFVIFPGATHSFDNPQARGVYLGHYLQYDQSAADNSIERTLRFLKEHFK